MATEYWQLILARNPQTPEAFMAVIYDLKPDISEHDVARWQRASRDWTTDVFEFMWFHLKIRQGDAKWQPHVQQLWPSVQTSMAAGNLDTLLSHMSL